MLSKLNKLRACVVLTLVCILMGATIGYSAIDLRVGYYGGGYHDTLVTYITTSAGGVYPATQAGLQSAIYSLNSTNGGEVKVPSCNITLTSTLYFISNLYLHGCGNSTILFLGNGANVDMVNIVSRHNILIESIFFNMNNDSQTSYNISLIDITGTGAYPSNNITISYCTFVNGETKSMIDCQENTYFITISHCTISKRYFRHGLNWGYGAGIWFSGSFCKALFNVIEDTYAGGICMEAATGSPPARDNLAMGNDISGKIGYGIYMEGSGSGAYVKTNNNSAIANNIHNLYSDCYFPTDSSPPDSYGVGIMCTAESIVSENKITTVPTCGIKVLGADKVDTSATIISNNLINDVYLTGGIGIWLSNSASTSNILIVGNSIENVLLGYGTKIPSTADNITLRDNVYKRCDEGVYNSGDNTSIINCRFIYMTGNGIENTGTTKRSIIQGCEFNDILGTYGIYATNYNSQFNDNHLINCYGYAFYFTGYLLQVNDNFITNYGTGTNGDGIHFHNSRNVTAVGNTINYGGVGGTSDGIELDDVHNGTIMGNHILVSDNGIKESGAPDGNIIIGNSIYGCTTKVTVVGTRTVNQYNQ